MKKIKNRLTIGFRLKSVGMRLLNKSKLKIQSKVLISILSGFILSECFWQFPFFHIFLQRVSTVENLRSFYFVVS